MQFVEYLHPDNFHVDRSSPLQYLKERSEQLVCTKQIFQNVNALRSNLYAKKRTQLDFRFTPPKID